MKRIISIFCISLCFLSCKSSKHSKSSGGKIVTHVSKPSGTTVTDARTTHDYKNTKDASELNSRYTDEKLADHIIDYAKKFEGVRYKYGGTTKAGMDCSGLVFESFKANEVSLPRVSRDMATQGIKIKLDDIMEGDLLFFETNPRKKGISHVGLVVTSRIGLVEFIHATTRAGVIISSLAERYWNTSFVEARRVL